MFYIYNISSISPVLWGAISFCNRLPIATNILPLCFDLSYTLRVAHCRFTRNDMSICCTHSPQWCFQSPLFPMSIYFTQQDTFQQSPWTFQFWLLFLYECRSRHSSKFTWMWFCRQDLVQFSFGGWGNSFILAIDVAAKLATTVIAWLWLLKTLASCVGAWLLSDIFFQIFSTPTRFTCTVCFNITPPSSEIISTILA